MDRCQSPRKSLAGVIGAEGTPKMLHRRSWVGCGESRRKRAGVCCGTLGWLTFALTLRARGGDRQLSIESGRNGKQPNDSLRNRAGLGARRSIVRLFGRRGHVLFRLRRRRYITRFPERNVRGLLHWDVRRNRAARRRGWIFDVATAVNRIGRDQRMRTALSSPATRAQDFVEDRVTGAGPQRR
jgi:hypothetical protein